MAIAQRPPQPVGRFQSKCHLRKVQPEIEVKAQKACHSESSEEPPHLVFAFAVAVVCYLFFPPSTEPSLFLLLSVSVPIKRTVISTEAAHALCEQRSGEIRFSTWTFTSRYHALAVNLLQLHSPLSLGLKQGFSRAFRASEKVSVLKGATKVVKFRDIVHLVSGHPLQSGSGCAGFGIPVEPLFASWGVPQEQSPKGVRPK